MTLIQAVNEADNLKPNMYELPEMIKWLSRLDKRIFDQILMTHVLSEEEKEPFLQDGKLQFDGYTEDDTETELIVKEPYDEIYVHWLEAQIDWNNMEYAGFNNTNAMFESVYGAFRNAFNQTPRPKGRIKTFF